MMKKRGTPGVYGVIYQMLDPLWLYTPAAIADFAARLDLLTLLKPDEEVPMFTLREQARIAFGVLRGSFPPGGDRVIRFKGRHFQAWQGWRWQKANSKEEALAKMEALLLPLWKMLDHRA